MMKRNNKITYLWVACIVGLLAACDPQETVQVPVEDAEVAVTVNMAVTRAVGDPGAGHGEDTAQWHTLALFLVYEDGRTVAHTISKADFDTIGVEHNYKHVAFNAFTGTVKTVYALAAYGTGEMAWNKDYKGSTAYSASEIKNLRTLPLDAAYINEEERMTYVRNLFSGKNVASFDITESDGTPGTANHVDVTLYRLAAKVDMQYDIQRGVENGNVVNNAMSDITFIGMKQGWFFPEEADVAVAADDMMDIPINGTVSERNGRAYFYTFPGNPNNAGTDGSLKDGIRFTLKTDGTGITKPFHGTFGETLESDSWYKVNLTVTGMTPVFTGDGSFSIVKK